MAIINKKTNTEGNKTYYSNSVFFDITEDISDSYYRLTEGTRLDIIAKKIYDDESLWWVIAFINNLDLSDYHISDEKVIRLPSKFRLQTILNEIKNNQK